jgi:hypothetical protein
MPTNDKDAPDKLACVFRAICLKLLYKVFVDQVKKLRVVIRRKIVSKGDLV